MISRRQIIKSQQQESADTKLREAAPESGYGRRKLGPAAGRKATESAAAAAFNQEEDYATSSGFPEGQQVDYRHFDPYSVYGDEDEEEDVWYSEERLFEDHMQEIINKWMAIDDEIWAKIICMERNRRIAKAYARKHSLTINGSRDEYLDGTTLGLNSFDNPDRDAKTRHIKQYIGHGLRIKITQEGDIVARRMSKSNIFLHLSQSLSYNSRSGGEPNYGFSNGAMMNQQKDTGADPLFSPAGYNGADSSQTSGSNKTAASGSSERTWPSSSQAGSKSTSATTTTTTTTTSTTATPTTGAVNSSKSQLQSRALEFNKSVRIFDMEKFKALLESETKQPCPDRKFLQNQCISVISFVLNDSKMLNLPSWIMVINIVAIDLLKSKLGFMTGLDLLEMPGPFEMGAADEEEEETDDAALDTVDDIEEQSSTGAADLVTRLRTGAGRPLVSRYTARRAEWPPVTCLKPEVVETTVDSSGDGAVSGDRQPATAASSSSSGFNSHCSSQNDSSANSSSSSAARAEEQLKKQQQLISGIPEKNPKQTQVVAEFKEKLASAGARYKQQLEPASKKPPVQESARGKRPPKLPHRLLGARRKSPNDDQCSVTNANLILVAPTGFSPPTPKRKGRPIVDKMLLQNSADNNPLHLNSIRLIDENGHCRIIKQQDSSTVAQAAGGMLARQSQVPLAPGIPAHAQLAPPATQRKILNYLMSHNNTITNGATTDSETSIYAPPMERHPRPLPMLPCHQKKLLAPQLPPPASHTIYDENLYYCGLQARVPVRHHQHHPPPSRPVDLKPPVISAMMNELRRTNPMYPHQHKLHQIRHQRSLNNLNGAGYQLYPTSHPRVFQQHNINKPSARPLLKLFKTPNAENQTPIALKKEPKSIFLSADNISQRPHQHKLSSILDLVHFPMKLRGSKNKLKT